MINSDAEIALDYLLSPEFELINSAGKPLTGGYIEVYIHGTRNKYYCYSDWAGTLHPFQIPLDSLGSNIVLASPDNAYDVYVYNKYGSLIMSRYNVHCQGTGSGGGSYAGDKLFYGQYTAHNVAETASLSKTKGNINLDSDGYLQLKQGMSYHITVRGAFQVNDVTNTETTLNYIEYSTISPIKVDVDFTKADPQNFELSYDIYDLAEDMAYKVAFEQLNGMVTDLVVEVHSLSNLATTATLDYEAGDYISIVDNTISVTGINPEDYSTHSETYESIVTAIQLVTGTVPSDAATHDEVYDATATAIDFVSGIIPEAQVQSDWTETDNTDPSYIQNKPNEYTVVAGDNIGIMIDNNDLVISASGTDLTGYVTDEDLQDAVEIVTAIIPDVSNFVTNDEVYEATVTAINAVTSIIPETQVQSNWTETDNTDPSYIQNKPNTTNLVAGEGINIIESSNNLVISCTGIPDVQVQSDWTQNDDTAVDYIKNKPNEYTVVAGQNIGITVDNNDLIISASGTDLTGYVTDEDLQDAVEFVTGLIPDTSTFATHAEVNNVSGAIVNEIPDVSDFVTEAQVTALIPEEEEVEFLAVEAGSGINIVQSATGIIISCSVTGGGGSGSSYTAGNGIDITNNEISVDNTVALKTDIPVVTGFATKVELQDGIELVTGMIPEEEEVDFLAVSGGNCIEITSVSDNAEIAWHTTAGITDIHMVTALPANPVSSILYIIPED